MADRLADLQAAITSTLSNDPGVEVAVGGARVDVYDIPPTNAPFPYFTLLDAHDLAVPAACFDSGDVVASIGAHDRSDPPGSLRAKRMASAAVAALTEPDGPLAGLLTENRLVAVVPLDTQVLQEPDGQSVRVIARLTISLDAA